MEALSRETLENMMEQAVAKATTVSFWPQGEAPSKTAMRCLRLNPDIQEHLSMIVRSPVFAPPEITVYAPQKPNGIGDPCHAAALIVAW